MGYGPTILLQDPLLNLIFSNPSIEINPNSILELLLLLSQLLNLNHKLKLNILEAYVLVSNPNHSKMKIDTPVDSIKS